VRRRTWPVAHRSHAEQHDLATGDVALVDESGEQLSRDHGALRMRGDEDSIGVAEILEPT
jgi:hypothetical protein